MEVNGEQISAETVLIAAGTRSMVPEIPGLDRVPYITSDEALRLPEQPRWLAILGGGYIAAEMAHFFALWEPRLPSSTADPNCCGPKTMTWLAGSPRCFSGRLTCC